MSFLFYFVDIFLFFLYLYVFYFISFYFCLSMSAQSCKHNIDISLSSVGKQLPTNTSSWQLAFSESPVSSQLVNASSIFTVLLIIIIIHQIYKALLYMLKDAFMSVSVYNMLTSFYMRIFCYFENANHRNCSQHQPWFMSPPPAFSQL